MSTYDLPDELQVRADGPVRVVTLNRPEQLNATNHVLHAGLAALFPQLDADDEARVAVHHRRRPRLLGRRRLRLPRRAGAATPRCGSTSLTHGRQIVTGMVRCRLPIVAAVNGPAVGLGCSLVALSDIVFMAESAHLADPHVLLGLVAADGGPVVWPLLTSLQLAKEYALTGDRIPAAPGGRDRAGQPRVPRRRGARAGHGVRPPHRPPAARARSRTPSGSSTSSSSGPSWPSLDFALSAEDRSFTTPELRANLDRLLKPSAAGGVTPGRAAQRAGSPSRCAAMSASQPPSASPAVSTWASAMARAAAPSPRAMASSSAACSRRLRSSCSGKSSK